MYLVIKGFNARTTKGTNLIFEKGDKFTNIQERSSNIVLHMYDDNNTVHRIENDFNIYDFVEYQPDGKKECDDECEKKLDVPNTYCSFTIANYALTDVIEALTAAKVKDIIVTKMDGDLIVKYKPNWRA